MAINPKEDKELQKELLALTNVSQKSMSMPKFVVDEIVDILVRRGYQRPENEEEK